MDLRVCSINICIFFIFDLFGSSSLSTIFLVLKLIFSPSNVKGIIFYLCCFFLIVGLKKKTIVFFCVFIKQKKKNKTEYG